jgi:hypothetical protein
MSTISRLSAMNPIAKRIMDAYNSDQERDERGRWGSGGPGSGAETHSEHAASAVSHATAAYEHHARGEHDAARAHEVAATLHQTASVTPESASGFGIPGSKAARNASRNANAESAKVGATPISRIQTQAGTYKGNPAAEGSRAVRADAARVKAKAFASVGKGWKF